jgi:hypothetical protein
MTTTRPARYLLHVVFEEYLLQKARAWAGQTLLTRYRTPDGQAVHELEHRLVPADGAAATGPDGLGRRACVVSLTHETRFEDDLFRTLMTMPRVSYVGCMGKRARHTEREARQAESGFDLSVLPPVHTPIGLDLGGKAPEDIALSIVAEIQASRHGRSGEPLSARTAAPMLSPFVPPAQEDPLHVAAQPAPDVGTQPMAVPKLVAGKLSLGIDTHQREVGIVARFDTALPRQSEGLGGILCGHRRDALRG